MSISKNTDRIYECAPMDGVTDFLYRQVQSRYFEPADIYYTPFLSLTAGHGFQEREFNEMNPENNRGMRVIPQLIGSNSEDFLWGIQEVADLGYDEVNLNMGCPSRTVIRKGKGSGMLRDLGRTERILDTIYERSPIDVSLKIRIGYASEEEFPQILELLNRFPVSKLIIHPRVQTQGYGGSVNRTAWEMAVRESRAPLSYSGDIFDREKAAAFAAEWPQIDTVMIGRGLVANPALIEEIRNGAHLNNRRLEDYHDALYAAYGRHLGKERYLIGRMKELWAYMGMAFDEPGELLTTVRRAVCCADYEQAVRQLFAECPVRQKAGFRVPEKWKK